MKTTFYQNGKKITRKAAESLLGKEKLEKRISEAKSIFRDDPCIQTSWTDGFMIEFS